MDTKNTNNTELLNESLQQEEQSNSPYFRKEIEGTPFVIIEENKIYWLTMGRYKMKAATTMEELEEMVEAKTWDLIADMIGVLTHYYTEELKNQAK